jgi:hypothetical protein
MSRDCRLYAYDADLKNFLSAELAEVSEVQTLQRRFGIPGDQIKNHLRCVALSRSASRYLFTAVDEAFCLDLAGNRVWTAKLPIQDGWTKVSGASSGHGTSEEIQQALALMKLSLPLSPEQLKSRYRELLKQWHPDLNPDDPGAGAKVRTLIAAAEILTGLDASSLAAYTGAMYAKELSRKRIDIDGGSITLTINVQVGELQVADWIYAASFAADSDSAYLAGYSGRVVVVSENGAGIRAYDIGCVPRRIIDTGDFLYLLTDTRLYVLRDEELHALVDTSEGGDLVMAQTGFGLLESKRLRWFRKDGNYIGSVLSKDPIRRVYQTGNDMTVETRQRRAVIQGVPGWW